VGGEESRDWGREERRDWGRGDAWIGCSDLGFQFHFCTGKRRRHNCFGRQRFVRGRWPHFLGRLAPFVSLLYL
jgi:hypothetical protein